MGMDVYGRCPSSEQGEYFRANIWFWRPLHVLIARVMPELDEKYSLGTNDGEGPDEDEAAELSRRLDALDIETVVAEWEAAREVAPQVTCRLCDGKGLDRHEEPCYLCNGTGQTKSWEANYPMTVEATEEFVEFVRHSGGFEIH